MFEVVTVIAEFKVVTSRFPTPVMFELDRIIESLIESRKILFVDIKLVETLLKETFPLFINKEIG